MGGLYVLLAVATMQVTYGWQSDGRGGVEYIVQVPPSEIDHIRHSGEITSTIHPAVRGHVSKVVIRVGTAELPRETPVDLAADRQAMAAPAIGVSDPQASSNVRTVMKPDPQRGMGMPSMDGIGSQVRQAAGTGADRMANGAANALNNMKSAAGATARGAMDQAAAGISNGARNTMGAARDKLGRLGNQLQTGAENTLRGSAESLRNAATSRTRTNNAANPNVAPDFTGGDRKDWFSIPENRANDARGTQDLRTRQPDFVGPPTPNSFSRNNPRLASSRTDGSAADQANAASGVGSTRNFGRVPNTNRTSTFSTDQQRAASTRDDVLRQPESRQNTNRNTINYANNQLPLGAGRNQVDTRSTANLRTIPRIGAEANAQTDLRVPARTTAASSLGNQRRSSQTPDYDPTLTYAQARLLPPGGYSYDRYTNPVNRRGEILDAQGYVVSAQRAYELTIGRTNPAFSNQAPANVAASQPTVGRPTVPALNPQVNTGNFPNRTVAPPAYTPTYQTAAVAAAPTYSPNINYQPPAQTYARTASAPISPSDQIRGQASPGYERPKAEEKKKSVTAQPLFAFLLLMSIAANVYLISRLLNLRNRFHDLVSSTRLAATPNSIAT